PAPDAPGPQEPARGQGHPPLRSGPDPPPTPGGFPRSPRGDQSHPGRHLPITEPGGPQAAHLPVSGPVARAQQVEGGATTKGGEDLAGPPLEDICCEATSPFFEDILK